MNFGSAVKNCFSNYATFSGRASRSEYWYFCLFLTLGNICTAIFDGVILGAPDLMGVNLIFTIITLLPSVAVGVRRLHDLNKTGWWLLVGITIIGVIPLIIWFIKAGDDSRNEYGLNPLKQTSTSTPPF